MAKPPEEASIGARFGSVAALGSPRIVARFNGLHVKLARGRGEIVWSRHEDTDLFVVPTRVEHRPVIEDVHEPLLIEPANTPNTGVVATATKEEWI